MKQALLLAGGLGTRLRPLTEQMPKPLAPIGNKPWLEHLIAHLREQGVRRFVIAAKHYADRIREALGDGERLGVSIRYSLETELLGTAGAIKNAEPYLEDRFLVVNADIIFDARIEPLLSFHRRHGGAVTIGLIEVEDPSHYGVVEQDERGRILRFVEKPKRGEAPSNRVNAGIYVMEKRALAAIPEGREVSIERETFPLLVAKNEVYGELLRGYWMDMGTKDRYRAVHWDLLGGRLKLPLPGREHDKGIRIGKGVSIAKGVLLVPPVLIGDEVVIGDRSIIGPNAVIGDRCVIGSRVRCAETIMWERCTVRDGTHLHNCIFGSGLEIGSGHIMHEAVMNRIEAMRA